MIYIKVFIFYLKIKKFLLVKRKNMENNQIKSILICLFLLFQISRFLIYKNLSNFNAKLIDFNEYNNISWLEIFKLCTIILFLDLHISY